MSSLVSGWLAERDMSIYMGPLGSSPGSHVCSCIASHTHVGVNPLEPHLLPLCSETLQAGQDGCDNKSHVVAGLQVLQDLQPFSGVLEAACWSANLLPLSLCKSRGMLAGPQVGDESLI